MGNRPFILPAIKKKESPDLTEWGTLNNKFSGKTLFRSKLYFLETGDLSVIDVINNRWFYEELISYSHTGQDINLLPALKKIAGSDRFDESLRQHASEIEEILEEKAKTRIPPGSLSGGAENEKAENARRILAGTRYPQTTEILRLLRDKSPELKRLALFLIGKFKMTDMVQEVCSCLNIRDIEEDAASVLLSLGSAVARELDRCSLAMAGNLITNKAVLGILARTRRGGDLSFVVERLWSNSRQIREMVINTLTEFNYRIGENDKERLKKNIIETFGTLAWIISAQVCLLNNNNTVLSDQMEKEYARWKDFLLGLLVLAYGESVTGDEQGYAGDKDDLYRDIPRLAEIIFTDKTKSGENGKLSGYKKKLKKLQRYFSCEVPGYKNLLEDIINCDYNLLSVWTKACTLRNIADIDNEDLSESVVALLFSPEALLREEAAKLIVRSGRDLYRITADRIPGDNRNQLDRIVAGEISERELIYEKVRFFSTCFTGVSEDELLGLAEKTTYVTNDHRGIYSQPANTILWLFPDEESEPEVIVNIEESADLSRIAKDIRVSCHFCYVLTLSSVREFKFQYPESSYRIFKYIDTKEE